MVISDKKAKLYGELAKVDPFEFWDADSIGKEFSTELKRLKKRHWMFIVYPESAPKDWKEQLEMTGIQFAVSPLHDRDTLVDGTLKKPHWHVIVIFDGPTTFLTASSYTGITKGPYPKVCENLKGSFDYFTHKNNPDKAQYSESDIEKFNGFDIEISSKDVTRIKKELAQFIIDRQITEYNEFDLFTRVYFENEYYEVACSNTYYFNSLIHSFRHNTEKILKRYEAIKEELSSSVKNNKEDNEHDT